MRLSREHKAWIERELYDYEFNKRELAEWKVDRAYNQLERDYGEKPEGNKKKGGSTTERACIEIISNRVMSRLTRTLEAIDNMKSGLSKEEKKFFDVFYRQAKSWQRTCIEIGIGKSTCYRWRDKIIKKTAEELGII